MATNPFPQNVTVHTETHHKHNFVIKPTTKTTIHIDLPVVQLEPSIIVNDSDQAEVFISIEDIRHYGSG